MKKNQTYWKDFLGKHHRRTHINTLISRFIVRIFALQGQDMVNKQTDSKCAHALLTRLLKGKKLEQCYILTKTDTNSFSTIAIYDKESDTQLFCLRKAVFASPVWFDPYSTGGYLTQYENEVLFNELETMCSKLSEIKIKVKQNTKFIFKNFMSNSKPR